MGQKLEFPGDQECLGTVDIDIIRVRIIPIATVS